MRCSFKRRRGDAICEFCGTIVPLSSLPHRQKCNRGGGPGAELEKMLAGWPLYITSAAGCPCKRHARMMDAWGPSECLRRIDEIIGWLEKEAANRGLPFVRTLAKALVRRAVARSRKNRPKSA